MAGELGQLKTAELPSHVFAPLPLASYFSRETPGPLPVDTSKLSAAKGYADVLNSIGDTIKGLPKETVTSYLQGQDLARRQANLALKDRAMRGALSEEEATQLHGASIDQTGGMDFKIPGPNVAALADIDLKTKEANLGFIKAHADSLNPHSESNTNPLFRDYHEQDLRNRPDFVPLEGARVTSYGGEADPYGKKGTKSATIGAFGDNALTPDSSAVSEDVEANLRKQGFKPGDRVRWHLSDGSSVDKIWDDRVATKRDLATIPSLAGLPSELHGRVDFNEMGGKNPHEGKKVVGFSRPATEDGAEGVELPEGMQPIKTVKDGSFKTRDNEIATPVPGGYSVKHVDGSTSFVPAFAKGGKPVAVKVEAKAARRPPQIEKLLQTTGYEPLPGETDDEVRKNATAYGEEHETIPPVAIPDWRQWVQGLKNEPSIKQYQTAKHEAHVIESALSDGLTPAAALGAIDAYVKAMRGGAATQGMTKILDESQSLTQQFGLKWQKLTGGSDTNAVLTPDMAKDITHIVSKIKDAAQADVEAYKEDSKEYLKDFHIPPSRVEKRMNLILANGHAFDVPGADPRDKVTSVPAQDEEILTGIRAAQASADPAMKAKGDAAMAKYIRMKMDAGQGASGAAQ